MSESNERPVPTREEINWWLDTLAASQITGTERNKAKIAYLRECVELRAVVGRLRADLEDIAGAVAIQPAVGCSRSTDPLCGVRLIAERALAAIREQEGKR